MKITAHLIAALVSTHKNSERLIITSKENIEYGLQNPKKKSGIFTQITRLISNNI